MDDKLINNANDWLKQDLVNEAAEGTEDSNTFGPVHEPAKPDFKDTQTPAAVNTEKPVPVSYVVNMGRQNTGTVLDNYAVVMGLNEQDAREKGAKIVGVDPMSLDFNVVKIVDPGILEAIEEETKAAIDKLQSCLKTLGPCINKMKEY